MSQLEVLILRLEAPLLSFGGVAIDERRPTEDYPAASMLTGLLANALGWHHRDWRLLDRLQARLRFAARRDRAGTRLDDFHTVDLGQDFMLRGWTTRGKVEGRKGASGKGTHIRDRRYWADVAYTVALCLDPAEEAPTVDALAEAVQRPERPLFLGRKTCLPSRPLVDSAAKSTVRAPSLLDALRRVPRWTRACSPPGVRSRRVHAPVPETMRAWWPEDEPAGESHVERLVPVRDRRDWRNQVHMGRRFMAEGDLRLVGEGGGDV